MKQDLPQPPKWADRFLEWYCKPELLEEIQGDIYELFYLRSEKFSTKAAGRRFVWDVFRSFRLSTIRNLNLKLSPVMFRANLKIAFRQMLKQKQFTFIKIGGFALGIAACLLIALFIRDELSYDQQYPDVDRLYRVVGYYTGEGDLQKGVHFPAPFASTLEQDYPEIEMAGRLNTSELFGAGSKEVRRVGEVQNTHEEGFIYADQKFLQVLGIPMVYGKMENALAEPNTLVISKSKADKYFPGENPVGKQLVLNNNSEKPMVIGGVMQDFPANAHLHFDFLMTMTGVEFWPGEQTLWKAQNYHTYVKLKPGADAEALGNKINEITEKYYFPAFQDMGSENARKLADQLSFGLQPMTDIHLHSEGIRDRLHHGDIRFVWLFGAIAIFILLIACINFINLSTAKSANRAREVGMRKVLGSFRSHLINQFLIESMVYSVFSFAAGLILASLALPFFNQLANKTIALPWQEWWFMPLLLIASIIVGLFAGFYPSLYLSSFKPMSVLQGNLSRGSKDSRMRNMLVVFQFTTSIVLLIGTFIIYQQMNYILNKKLGFNKDQVVLLQGTNTLEDKIFTFRDELVGIPQVESATLSNFLPIAGTQRNGNSFWREGKQQEEEPVFSQFWRVDYQYLSTLNIQLVEGRDFSTEMASDSQAIIINQSLAKRLNLAEPLGKRITNFGDPWTIIGVIEDFHFESMREEIGGLAMVLGGEPTSLVSLKVSTDDMAGILGQIGQVWDEFSPHQTLQYTFLDEDFATMYDDVQRMGQIFVSFAILAIIVACLGLFGLSAFIAEQRSKEISIRKVLGASMNNIIRLLSQSFLGLVLISLVIAIPVGWFLMKQWLQDFAYRIDIGWEVFVYAGLIAFAIAIITISFQTLRTATANPIDALRKE